MMRVSRNDIYFNKVSIGNACDNIGSIMSGILTSLGSAGTLLTSGTKIKNNIVKMYAISSLAKATSQSLQNDMDDINKLYNENVISYENMDDTYKSKASELYDKYSSVWEKFTTTVGGIGKASVDIVKGFFSSLVGLVKGVFDILKAAVVYIGAGFGAISEKITGDAPDCLKSCERKVKEYNKTIVEIVKDPFSLIEGLSQTLNDTYEEKGIAYMGGYVVGEVAQVLLLKKVSGVKSAKGIDGVEDAAKTVKNVDKAEDGSKIAKESSAIKGVSKADDFYRKNPSDPIRDILGSGIESNPTEWNKLINDMKNSGVEIVYRDGTMAYSPGLVPGAPGQLIIDKNASMSALIHEYQHYLDDVASGLPGMRQLYEQNPRIIKELRAYMKEIKIADELGLKEVSEQLWKNYRQERDYILNLFKE